MQPRTVQSHRPRCQDLCRADAENGEHARHNPELPLVAALEATATLPAVAALAATATLPAVATLPATATLPAVAALWTTPMLRAVRALPATATLPAVPTLPVVAVASAAEGGLAESCLFRARTSSWVMITVLPELVSMVQTRGHPVVLPPFPEPRSPRTGQGGSIPSCEALAKAQRIKVRRRR